MAASDVLLEKEQGFLVTGKLVVVQLDTAFKSIQLAPGSQLTEEQGTIRRLGLTAFEKEHPGMFSVGDRVMFRRYGGQQFRRWADEEFVPGEGRMREEEYFCIVNDTDVLLKILDREDEIAYIAEHVKPMLPEIEKALYGHNDPAGAEQGQKFICNPCCVLKDNPDLLPGSDEIVEQTIALIKFPHDEEPGEPKTPHAVTEPAEIEHPERGELDNPNIN